MNATIEKEVVIKTESDIVVARRAVREGASALGFGLTDTTRIVTAASELARNIIKYAVEGTMVLHPLEDGTRTGIELTFVDHGPGIPDIAKAMKEGFSTSGGFGMGLPGAKRLMDEMDAQSAVGQGTTVTVRKWRRQ
ncbi:MAG: anti-sigma regulatory factor [Planctomycetota bacterium]|nr:anti-sigma regulatory factor [Planctomycetota bacterium]